MLKMDKNGNTAVDKEGKNIKNELQTSMIKDKDQYKVYKDNRKKRKNNGEKKY